MRRGHELDKVTHNQPGRNEEGGDAVNSLGLLCADVGASNARVAVELGAAFRDVQLPAKIRRRRRVVRGGREALQHLARQSLSRDDVVLEHTCGHALDHETALLGCGE